MPSASATVQPAISPAVDTAISCMKTSGGLALGCPENSPYEPMGICTLMLKISVGSVAPFLPMLDVILGLPGSILDVPNLPNLAEDLPGLPFSAIGSQDLPPVPISIPSFGLNLNIGSLELPAWDGLALGNLLVSILTIPINFAIDLLTFKIPDVSFDGVLKLVLGAISVGLNLPTIMLPKLGLLDFAVCIVKLIILPIIILLTALGAVVDLLTSPEDEGGAGIQVPPIPTLDEMNQISGENLTDDEKKVRAAAVVAKMIEDDARAREEAEAAIAAEEQFNKQSDSNFVNSDETVGRPSRRNRRWKPGLGDDFYG